ncbi:hypothetical protein AURANDRAFT_70648 [Aureococcus anophagefferens]|uniref:Uncharacterized protein n=1 Tax=Aureococcus anophagefferens TaxID=44056 RepID=F0XYT4_AURAN|nr:hypothetical protein AURANDRAFT_70648 [Aureococcus anophagefferens]EGB11821.1 hypothetical protein AURANDRAFT_70648 [Aureococcus anophagefferens]|eukprot:XP_009032945.1 hypothetical protein AURANDRAFT_70648 [Aureococcus anophagefferens]
MWATLAAEVVHASTAAALTPDVFGTKTIMVPAYAVVVAIKVLLACGLLAALVHDRAAVSGRAAYKDEVEWLSASCGGDDFREILTGKTKRHRDRHAWEVALGPVERAQHLRVRAALVRVPRAHRQPPEPPLQRRDPARGRDGRRPGRRLRLRAAARGRVLRLPGVAPPVGQGAFGPPRGHRGQGEAPGLRDRRGARGRGRGPAPRAPRPRAVLRGELAPLPHPERRPDILRARAPRAPGPRRRRRGAPRRGRGPADARGRRLRARGVPELPRVRPRRQRRGAPALLRALRHARAAGRGDPADEDHEAPGRERDRVARRLLRRLRGLLDLRLRPAPRALPRGDAVDAAHAQRAPRAPRPALGRLPLQGGTEPARRRRRGRAPRGVAAGGRRVRGLGVEAVPPLRARRVARE